MNLQQLNHSGQSIWWFLGTALASLLATGFIWFCLELYNTIVDKARREVKNTPWLYSKVPRQSFPTRVAVYLGLVR